MADVAARWAELKQASSDGSADTDVGVARIKVNVH